MKSFLQLKFIPLNPSLGLLILRVWLGGSMLALHGWGKLQKVVKGDFSFGDPFHMGETPTLILAVTIEVLASVFLILGFMGRFSALMLAGMMLVAWAVTHKMKLTGLDNGELAFIYLAGFLTIVFAGTGKYGIEKA